MCGIAGIVAPGKPAALLEDQVRRMALALRHRGPDGQGVVALDGVALAHTRLAIIDLRETGRQPMVNEDGSLHLVVNGEIYNYRELRANLQQRGHGFRSASDSEVILHLYEDYGDDCLSSLDGMFAFALWDASRRRLLLARDRFGIKPLYVVETDGGLAFASELIALVRGGMVGAEIDPQALYEYMALSYVPAPRTILKGARKLLPAERLVWHGGQSERRIYWIPKRTAWRGSRQEAREALAGLLDSAVRSHLVADVPVAAFLSGGVDSSTVTAFAQRHGKLDTFCVSFPDTGLDEAPIARRVADHLGTRYHEVTLRPDPSDLFAQALASMDEPLADASALPTFALCQAARPMAKVVLSGDGGDEVFGGYTGRYRVAALQAALPGAGGLARWLRRMPPWRAGRRRALPDMLELAALPDAERFVREREITSAEDRLALFGPERASGGEPALRLLPGPALQVTDGWHPVHRALWLDLATPLADDMLTKVDRMSMAHGLEVRVPFLDHRLVEFALSLRPEWLVSPWPVEGKRLLREVVRPRLPPGVLDRPKQGFSPPLDRWFRDGLLARFDAECLGPGSHVTRWMDAQAIVALRRRAPSAEPRYDLYALLVLEGWLRRMNSSESRMADS
ncbi:asparagine synthase (glutamine-hydrolyzing) [Nitrospira sp. Kam-Ns4a]